MEHMNIANDNKAKGAAPCPICRKPLTEAYRPFCSKRCADVDLARWLGGTYAIPVSGLQEDDDEDERPSRETRREGDD
jgi:endogenous inhibitor of DNA gyrase (YacG/DUF329 family)